jgi:hypothetical protein
MILDDVIALPATYDNAAQSMRRSVSWAKRAAAHRKRDDQSIFGIVQGGTWEELRKESAQSTVGIGFDGYAIGGLAVGETAEEMDAMVEITAAQLPENQPRYLMGVGTPRDLKAGVLRGVDMFDCVLPTRLARHNVGITENENINFLKSKHKFDFSRSTKTVPVRRAEITRAPTFIISATAAKFPARACSRCIICGFTVSGCKTCETGFWRAEHERRKTTGRQVRERGRVFRFAGKKRNQTRMGERRDSRDGGRQFRSRDDCHAHCWGDQQPSGTR